MNTILTTVLLVFGGTVALAQSEVSDRVLDKNYYPSTLEQATLRLTASNRVSNSQPVEYRAGKSVLLTTGFQTRPGTTFLANTNVLKGRESESAQKLAVTSYPNPFTERATITYQLAEADYTSVYVSDLEGKQVKRLVDKQLQEAGRHEVVWQADQLPPGVYICTLETGRNRISARVIRR